MIELPESLRELIETGPLAHLSTINADGSPQVTVIWIGLDGEQLVSGHMSHSLKLRNIERDPRVVLSIEGPRERSGFRSPYAALRARATVAHSDHLGQLFRRLAETYMAPEFQLPPGDFPGYIARYDVERISGVGPWVA